MSSVPQKVGPYRVDERIGRGGMGEVYRGYDLRLDRSVALKRVRSEGGPSAVARERFRREGRSLARVRHPAVVAVYDWIEGDDGDWLVMEHLEGRPLAALLGEGPLPPLDALQLIRPIAAGLAAVHAQGIVHRDLKPRNIMLVPEPDPAPRNGLDEQVKILDFGLAKRIVSMDGLTLTESISKEEQLVGTVRFMSPEQAAGRRVDERSDLFSLGVILYTMLTGQSPFGTGDLVETLTRICTAAEVPVDRIDPEVPKPISELVRRLLLKDPNWRPQTARQVLGAVDMLIEGFGSGRPELEMIAALPGEANESQEASRWLDEETKEQPRAARLKQDVPGAAPGLSGDSSTTLDGTYYQDEVPAHRQRRAGWLRVAALVGTLLLSGWSLWEWSPWSAERPLRTIAVAKTVVTGSGVSEQTQLRGLAIRTGVLRALHERMGIAVVEPTQSESTLEDPARLAQVLGAAETLASAVECLGSQCRVSLKRVLADGPTTWQIQFTDPTVSFLALSHLTEEQLQSGLEDFEPRPDIAERGVRPEDYEVWLRVQQQSEQLNAPAGELVSQLQEIRQTSPRFLEAYILEAGILRQRFYMTRESESLDRAIELLRQALDIAPESPVLLRHLAFALIEGGHLDEAQPTLEELARFDPGDATLYSLRALLLERQGAGDEALPLMREAARRRGSIDLRMDLARMEYRQGNLAEARAQAEEALELDPNRYRTLSGLAEFELIGGSLERSAKLYERLVEQVPEEAELTNLGVVYLLLEQTDEAIQAFERVLELAPSSPFASLNLADAFYLQGDTETATTHYATTLEKVEADPNPDQLLTVGAQALAHLGRSEEAVGAVQRALRLAPDNPQIQFEAALVYILVGERTSALLHARRALELGVERRWFDFPWFDPLRNDLEASDGV